MRARLEPSATYELEETTAYLADQSIRAAEAFITEVVAAIELLIQFPRIGTLLEGDVRRFLLKTIPYQLIYRVLGEEIRVYAVAHLKRKPGYWRKRVLR